MKTIESENIDDIMDKYINIDEGAKMDSIGRYLKRHMNTSIEVIDKGITALRLNRIEQLSDKQKQLLQYQKELKQMKSTLLET